MEGGLLVVVVVVVVASVVSDHFFRFLWLFLCDICRYAHQCLKLVGVWPKCQNLCDLDLESGGFDGPKSCISLRLVS